jgi:hypothetical protein
MLNEGIAAKHFLRFMCLRFAPKDDKRQKEIIDALREAAISPDHCARIVGGWIRKNSQFPTPFDIYQTAEAIASHGVAARPDGDCRSCEGTGFEQVWELVTWERRPNGAAYKSIQAIEDRDTAAEIGLKADGKTQIVYDCVRRCKKCEYGRSLAEAAAARGVSAA